MTYAKIENGLLVYAPDGVTDGYKPLTQTAAPSSYHIKSYDDLETAIMVTWVAPNLETLQAIKRGEADAVKDTALLATVNIDVPDVGSVVYNQQAQANVSGTLGLMNQGLITEAPYTLADDSVITATETILAVISLAFYAHVAGIYSLKTYAYTLIDATESVDGLLALDVLNLELPTDSEEVSE